ncbi:hypothetical protein MPSEU_000407600 [Mayamaea pseudoterrestris]|nr:hypothetical protein MPSEU_000407600 [Mayamaea pseudoterrestris]
MKLDPTVMRSMDAQDFRVLEAIEKGMKQHYIVPLALINVLANLRHGGSHKIVSTLLRDKLISHERNKKQSTDGYRITNAGYDILALHHLKKTKVVAALGQRIGTGKESDVYLAAGPGGEQIVLKMHRLGRTSFRNVRKKRDYFGARQQNQAHSWLFMSRLSALKEYAFMKALFDVDYPTPKPIGHNRHIVAMSLVRGVPLYQIYPKQLSADQAADIYKQAMSLASRLSQHGLVHCDLNEFNLLVDLSGIQSIATASDDAYVRHSGLTVADERTIGSLSKPAWQTSLEEQDAKVDVTPPEPLERLDSGEPKPIVTLIDFPQMCSTKHPNAKEYYERDLACLRRFFEQKLQFQIPEEDEAEFKWECVSGIIDGELDSKRLDQELRATGYYESGLNRDLELYYFTSGPQAAPVAVIEEGTEDDDEEEDDDDDDSDGCDEDECSDANGDSASVPDKSQDALNLVEDMPDDFDSQSEAKQVELEFDDRSIMSMSREQIQERARIRVRQHLDKQKLAVRQQGAFRKRNSNKTYIKGKRVMTDFGI